MTRVITVDDREPNSFERELAQFSRDRREVNENVRNLTLIEKILEIFFPNYLEFFGIFRNFLDLLCCTQ